MFWWDLVAHIIPPWDCDPHFLLLIHLQMQKLTRSLRNQPHVIQLLNLFTFFIFCLPAYPHALVERSAHYAFNLLPSCVFFLIQISSVCTLAFHIYANVSLILGLFPFLHVGLFNCFCKAFTWLYMALCAYIMKFFRIDAICSYLWRQRRPRLLFSLFNGLWRSCIEILPWVFWNFLYQILVFFLVYPGADLLNQFVNPIRIF